MIRINTILLMAALGLTMSAQVYAVPRYHVIPIISGHANGINGKGDVVGQTTINSEGRWPFYTTFSGGHAFIFKQVTPTYHIYTDLGVYSPTPIHPVYQTMEGMAVNNSDTVVGGIFNWGYPLRDGVDELDAFIYENGKIIDIAQGTDDGGASAYATSINNKGDVVGVLDVLTFLYNSFGESQAFICRNGVVTPLNIIPVGNELNYSIANSINNAGQVVGGSYSESNGTYSAHGFLWINGKTYTIGPSGFVPRCINDNGWIVGYNFTSHFEAVLYVYGLTIQLGEGEAVSINNGGTVVGNTFATGSYPSTGVFIYVIGKRYDINTLVDGGWTITEVGQINDVGQIAATGTMLGSTVTYALLLTPDWDLFR
jgi:probable HAF family extracellular repeat protein